MAPACPVTGERRAAPDEAGNPRPDVAPPSALVLFAHGARDPEWAAPILAIQRRVRERRPELAVEVAFLEIMRPPLEDVVGDLARRGHHRVTIAPLFIAQGGHLRRDLPQLVAALRTRHPEVELALLPAIGEVEPVLAAISSWLAASTDAHGNAA